METKIKNPRNQIRGAQNRSAGKELEALVAVANQFYAERQIAVIEKTPEPVKYLAPIESGRFVACYEKKAQPDFKGCMNNGRCVCFECKETSSDRIMQSVVTPEQTEVLNKYAKFHAVCFVLVSFGLMSFYRIPWSIWVSMKNVFGHKYITKQEAEPYKVDFCNGVLAYMEKLTY